MATSASSFVVSRFGPSVSKSKNTAVGLADIVSSLQCRDGIAAVLAAQKAHRADARRVGVALRRLRAMLPEKTAGRNDGQNRLHRRCMQAAGSGPVPLPPLYAPARARPR